MGTSLHQGRTESRPQRVDHEEGTEAVSVYGWRWWDLSKEGALHSMNDQLWEPTEDPSEGLHATCYDMPEGMVSHHHTDMLRLADGTIQPVIRGSRPRGASIIREPVPGIGCTCGFWAYYDPEQAFVLPRTHGHTYLKSAKVFGVIEAWGGIAWMELGFRCEYAAVRAVIVQRGKLHKAYEVQRYKNLEDIMRDWDTMPLEDES